MNLFPSLKSCTLWSMCSTSRFCIRVCLFSCIWLLSSFLQFWAASLSLSQQAHSLMLPPPYVSTGIVLASWFLPGVALGVQNYLKKKQNFFFMLLSNGSIFKVVVLVGSPISVQLFSHFGGSKPLYFHNDRAQFAHGSLQNLRNGFTLWLTAWIWVWRCTVTCERLYTQVCVFPDHVKSIELVTVGLLSSSWKPPKIIKSKMHLSSI